jgi:hypothetical protein
MHILPLIYTGVQYKLIIMHQYIAANISQNSYEPHSQVEI